MEHAAIIAYTQASGDYRYMNAAAANSPEWMAAIKSSKSGAGLRKLDDQTLREEGALHTALAAAGLNKLDPHRGTSYRGEAISEAEFHQKVSVGKVINFANLVSTTKRPEITLSFAAHNLEPDKDVALFWAFTNSGGRDIEVLSALTGEGEVLLLPGSSFVTSSVVDVGAPGAVAPKELTGFYDDVLRAKQADGELAGAHRCYLVRVRAASKKRAPKSKAARPPKSAASSLT